ncbi:MAG: Spy/CpxP family protein refolding chaperone [Proteobacteria bacterium]|nr:Spy/CpxP family protein refolding chaperone [Pseudomonadota bacterium]
MFEAVRVGLRGRLVGLATAAAVISGAVAMALPAQAEMHGPGMHGPAMGGPGMLFMGPPEHVAQHVDHFLKGLNATDAQRTQIVQIAQAAATDLEAQHAAEMTLHQQSMQIFSSASVDAAAAESVRAQLEAQHDQASRRVLQAMLDIGNVLTPEQRAAIGTRMQQHEAMMQQHAEHMKQQGQQ